MVLSVLKPCLTKLGLVGVLVMVLSGLGRPASAGTVADPNEFTDHEALAHDEAFDSVGRFIGATETSAYSASGVYLGDGWVLTAAHVVDEATSLSFEIGGATYEAEAWAYHADWNPADIVSGGDIALVKLAGDAAPPITGATLYTGSEEDLPADYVFLSIGFTGQDTPAVFERLGVEMNRGVVKAEYGKFGTNVDGVFAAGDVRRGASLIVWAIAEGRGAARSIDEFLMGESSLPAPDMIGAESDLISSAG